MTVHILNNKLKKYGKQGSLNFIDSHAYSFNVYLASVITLHSQDMFVLHESLDFSWSLSGVLQWQI